MPLSGMRRLRSAVATASPRLRTRLKSFADSRGTSSVAEGAGLGRLKGKQQHKVPLSDAADVALGEVASNKTHYARQQGGDQTDNFFEKRQPLMSDWANFCTSASKKLTKRKHSTRHE
jgi:hypothetical protein